MNQKSTMNPTEEDTLQQQYPDYRGVDPDYQHAGTASIERLRDWKFGLRIHWGPYCMFGFRESWGLPLASHAVQEDYERKATAWNPVKFDATKWTDLMARAGLKYFTFTTKHHDGFSMYDTATRVRRRLSHSGPQAGKIIPCDLAYGIMETPFRRDVVNELVTAGRERGLGIGLYYSHIDWFDSDFRIDEWNYQRDPAYTRESDPAGFQRMLSRHREQIREICTRYGQIDLLSLDMRFPDAELGITPEIIETVKMARSLQPGMLIRNRGIGAYGDYESPERRVPSERDSASEGYAQLSLKQIGKPWKVIYPGSLNFSYLEKDEYKPASWILERLIDVSAKGGAFQIGYGPDPEGEWHKDVVDRLETVGEWLRVNGEAIYSTRPFEIYQEGQQIRYTRSKDGRVVYAVFMNFPDPSLQVEKLRLKALAGKAVSKVSVLGIDEPFRFESNEAGLEIELPAWLGETEKRPSSFALAFRIELAA